MEFKQDKQNQPVWYWHSGHQMIAYNTDINELIEKAYTQDKLRSDHFIVEVPNVLNGKIHNRYFIEFGDHHSFIQRKEVKNNASKWVTDSEIYRNVRRVKYRVSISQISKCNHAIKLTLEQAKSMSDQTKWYSDKCVTESEPAFTVIEDSKGWWTKAKKQTNKKISNKRKLVRSQTDIHFEPAQKKLKISKAIVLIIPKNS